MNKAGALYFFLVDSTKIEISANSKYSHGKKIHGCVCGSVASHSEIILVSNVIPNSFVTTEGVAT